MTENISENPSISSLLRIHYDKRFIPVARSFVEAQAPVLGIAEESARWLNLLVEESLAFVMEKYVDSRLDAHIELVFKLFDGGVAVIEITDIGPPIHEDRVPEFDLEDDASESGLWYKLVKDVADDFSFINQHKDGWLIRMEKKVAMDGERAGLDRDSAPEAKPSLADHRIRLATPGDAAELMDLAFLTYRYSYAADFYNKELLERAISRGTYEITVLDNGSAIVGAYVVIHPESGEKWAEIGSAMVLPEYRTTRAVMYLFRAMGEYMKENPRGLDYFTSHIVTSHTRSQKLLHKIQPPFKPLFLFPNMVPRPEFVGIKQGSEGRESLIWSFSLKRPLRQDVLYAPESRRAMLRELLDNTGHGDAVAIEEAYQEPAESESLLHVERVEQQGFAMVHLETMGADWFTAMAREIMAQLAKGIENIAVTIPTMSPPPPDMEKQLASINLLFSGIHLAAVDSLKLVYCLTTKPIDFENIHLHDPAAQKLLETMRTEYQALQRA
ncbi:hypothetical protein [Desulfohalovibrio reitneri]|uniref:hypothetical protein n=1 Tax=Desulfohalovibrio reitneri TaxID=1307759 RepID=UPI000A98D8D0|nr:hypothetical protein [Desulfohalovibrio reitneri]